jgi:hypothetical protein
VGRPDDPMVTLIPNAAFEPESAIYSAFDPKIT